MADHNYNVMTSSRNLSKGDFKTPEIFWISDEINLTQLRYIVISNMVIDKKNCTLPRLDGD